MVAKNKFENATRGGVLAAKKRNKVGVVMPAHNSSEKIERALRSVLSQSYGDFEIFVVDDHPTDETVKIVESFCEQDKRVHLATLIDDRGAAAARNLAIKQIESDPTIKYVAFLDSDDQWREDKLKTQIEFMQESGALFSYGDYDIMDNVTGEVYKQRICPKKMSYLRMLAGCSVGCLTVMYDRDAVGQVSIPNLQKRNDYAMWCAILKKVRRGSKYPGALAVYDRSPNGVSSGNKVRLIKHHYRMHRDSNHFGPVLAGALTMMNVANYIVNITVREKRYASNLEQMTARSLP